MTRRLTLWPRPPNKDPVPRSPVCSQPHRQPILLGVWVNRQAGCTPTPFYTLPPPPYLCSRTGGVYNRTLAPYEAHSPKDIVTIGPLETANIVVRWVCTWGQHWSPRP